MNFQKRLTVLLLLLTGSIFAQKFELGKVSVAELSQKSYPNDTTAAAAILYNKGKSTFVYDDKKGFSLVHEYEFRIKIYKKEGLNWADFKVPYYVGYENLNKDMVRFSNAVTYNLENGQIVKTKLTGEGRFKNDVNEFWNEASITMPNVKPGSVMEFKYTLKSEDIVAFPEYNFQYDIPVVYSEYKTEIPQFFRYNSTQVGFGQIKSDAKVVNGYQNFANEHNQSVNLSYQQVNSSYIAENIPALKEEPYVDNIENYRLSIQHELEKTVFPDAPEKMYASSWESVATSIYKDERFGKELQTRSYFEPFLEPILKNATTDVEKATAILEFVKRTVSWNNQYGYYTKKGVRKAFDDRSGNVAEVNFILIAMLNHAGINADPVLVSTVSHGVPVYPNRTVFNYVIAAIALDGKQILLDATDKYATLDVLPERALNWTGRLIKKDGTSKEINLVPAMPSKQAFNVMAVIAPDGKVSGKLKATKTNYDALVFRSKYAMLDRGMYTERLMNKYSATRIADYVSDNATDLSKPATEGFSFESDNEVEIIDGKMFLNPLLFFTIDKNPFTLEDRKFPIYYGYPFQLRYNLNIEIPAGYVVESMPKSIKLATGEQLGSFTFTLVNQDNKIQIAATQEINSAIVSGDFYPNLKEFYKQMIDKQHEKIILKKI